VSQVIKDEIGDFEIPVDELLRLVDAITPAQVKAVAQEFFDPSRMTVVSLGPEPVAN